MPAKDVSAARAAVKSSDAPFAIPPRSRLIPSTVKRTERSASLKTTLSSPTSFFAAAISSGDGRCFSMDRNPHSFISGPMEMSNAPPLSLYHFRAAVSISQSFSEQRNGSRYAVAFSRASSLSGLNTLHMSLIS